MKLAIRVIFLVGMLVKGTASAQTPVYKDASRPLEVRVKDLVSRLSLEEKISLLGYNSKAIPRLGIPAYNWWNEGLHGVARAGSATIFPQAIGMAATFDDELIKQVSTVISTEARAKYNLAVSQGRRQQYMGLTFWTPNINIFRDPRWGRGQETYGEDPFLTSRMGTAFVKGLQGDDPHYLKASATAKHYAVHSGPEAGRHEFNAIIDEKDLRETYLYAFKKLVDGGVESVMCAYNRVNGEACCNSNTLLSNILLKEWGFKGHVVTDCWALDDIYLRHKIAPDAVHVAAEAIKAGVDLDCSTMLQSEVLKAVKMKLLTENDVNKALSAILRTEFKLGFYDEQNRVPYHTYGADSVHTDGHIALARKVAQKSMVLLKNNGNLLPLNKTKYNSIMVVGPNAASYDALIGNYHGVSKVINYAEGITAAVGPGTRVEYDLGADNRDTVHFGGVWAAQNSDVTVAVLGLSPVNEGEEGDAFLAEGGGDRLNISLPASHIAYLKKLRAEVKKPIIAVITAGSDVDIEAIAPYADAIILAWYAGEQGGNAFADILFGNVSPSGHLPLTFYKSLNNLPDYKNYNMAGRTYRYYGEPVQYPFGFGLSYTSFTYAKLGNINAAYKKADSLTVAVSVKNTGNYAGDAVVQAYIEYPKNERMPLKELKAFKRIGVEKGEQKNVTLKIAMADLQKWNLDSHTWKLYPGTYKIIIGENANDQKLLYTFLVR